MEKIKILLLLIFTIGIITSCADPSELKQPLVYTSIKVHNDKLFIGLKTPDDVVHFYAVDNKNPEVDMIYLNYKVNDTINLK
jgi:hypothetical protein